MLAPPACNSTLHAALLDALDLGSVLSELIEGETAAAATLSSSEHPRSSPSKLELFVARMEARTVSKVQSSRSLAASLHSSDSDTPARAMITRGVSPEVYLALQAAHAGMWDDRETLLNKLRAALVFNELNSESH
jgi:hypothetical protein